MGLKVILGCEMQLSEVYAEIYRVLKPGAIFASYEWVSTAKYDASNKDHVRIIDEINFGNGLPVCTRSPSATPIPHIYMPVACLHLANEPQPLPQPALLTSILTSSPGHIL